VIDVVSGPRYPPRILLVDDTPDTIEELSRILAFAGFVVVTANSGAEALRKATLLLPNVIVTDVALPDMSGLALCRAIREDERTASIPVVGLGGDARPGLDVKRPDGGFDAFLWKPCDPDRLVWTTRAVIEAHR
jgi:CheY-like chemotaxis protein